MNHLDQFKYEKIDKQFFVNEDCFSVMESLPEKHVDIIVTSPPYNLNIDYGEYHDKKEEGDYFSWINDWLTSANRVLKDDGSIFLNVAGSVTKPHIPWRILDSAFKHFSLQNQIIWVKSIHIPEAVQIEKLKEARATKCDKSISDLIDNPGHSFGHFKPVNSDRFLNNTHEFIFHLTKKCDVVLDKIAVGVPYVHPSNLNRWKTKKDRRCKGNVWYIPYVTRAEAAIHPAQFPVELPEQCIKLHGKKDCVVVDTFGGVGNTALACAKLGISCVSIEMDKDYHDHAISRRSRYNKKSKVLRNY